MTGGRCRNPAVRNVAAPAEITASASTTHGPKAGSANHRVVEKKTRMSAVLPKATARVVTRRRATPPRMPIQATATSVESARMTVGEMVGSANQLLNSIAAYCFSMTATQKIGSEKNRKAAKVNV